jgi:hypothetical protein
LPKLPVVEAATIAELETFTLKSEDANGCIFWQPYGEGHTTTRITRNLGMTEGTLPTGGHVYVEVVKEGKITGVCRWSGLLRSRDHYPARKKLISNVQRLFYCLYNHIDYPPPGQVVSSCLESLCVAKEHLTLMKDLPPEHPYFRSVHQYCRNGHPLLGRSYAYYKANKNGRSYYRCAECQRETQKRYRERKAYEVFQSRRPS